MHSFLDKPASLLRRAAAPVFTACLLLYLPALSQNHFGPVAVEQSVQSVLNNAFSLDSLQKFVKQLSGVLQVQVNGAPMSFQHRYAGNGSQNFRNAALFVRDVLARYGMNPVIENNASPWTKINVVGTLPGRRGEYVVICGHFDSANLSCPGADDNASGTAAVLEAARILRALSFEYTIKFIAFGGEEQGMKGSKQYMEAHPQDSIRAVINCDMIMWDNDEDRNVHIHAIDNTAQQKSADLAVFIHRIDSVYAFPTMCRTIIPGIGASDHSSFWNKDRSAVLLIEEYQEDFNFYYHTSNDTFSNASAPKHQNFFRDVSKLTIASIAHLAQVRQPVPVELSSFTAELLNTGVLLSWRTESEINNAGFRIERAFFPSASYEEIGHVSGHGASLSPRDYSHLDANLAPGVRAYRLRQIDSDGTESLSGSVIVHVGIDPRAALHVAAWPNPARSAVTVACSLPGEADVSVRIIDALGRTVDVLRRERMPAGLHHLSYDASALPRGSYMVAVETASGSAVSRLNVSR